MNERIASPAQRELPPLSDDPMEAVLRDRKILRDEIASLNRQLNTATHTAVEMQAELIQRGREIARLQSAVTERNEHITRLQAYVFSIRTRLKVVSEQAVTAHEEAMSEALKGLLEPPKPPPAHEPAREEKRTGEADKPAEEAAAAEAAEILNRVGPTPGTPLPDNRLETAQPAAIGARIGKPGKG